MKKFFITGISGSGKSSILKELKLKGFSTIDIDDIEGLCTWVNNNTLKIEKWKHGMTDEWYNNHKYICDKEKLVNLMNKHNGVVVVACLPSNRRELLALFDKVFILQCAEDTFIKRIKERTNNDFGKHVLEQENLLSWYKNFETDMLARGAISINTDQSLMTVVNDIISKF